MFAALPSELAGPAFLSIILAAAVALAARSRAPEAPLRLLPAGCLALALQAAHVAEEFAAGFHLRLPRLVGLDPWSAEFFVSFNLAWIALWALALRAFAGGAAPLAARAALWFLALAAIGNAIWHPALSVATGAYFAGTATALPLGAAGLLLVRRLSPGRRTGSGS
jgi:hypothetical protein